jgi:hypothetical protein
VSSHPIPSCKPNLSPIGKSIYRVAHKPDRFLFNTASNQRNKTSHWTYHLSLLFQLALLVSATLLPTPLHAWPLDGYPDTGIRRLEQGRLIQTGELPGRKQPVGATKSTAQVQLHLADSSTSDSLLFREDPVLQKRLGQLFANLDKNYSLSLLVLRPGEAPRYAAWRDQVNYQPGSVGKLAVVTGLYSELARRYPADTAARRALLKSRQVKAEKWIQVDTKKAPFYDPVKKRGELRKFNLGDQFSLYEWADHMMSPSSNAAASTVWKEMILMRGLDAAYPPTPEAEKSFWADTPPRRLTDLAFPTVNDPLYAAGVDSADFRLGSLFTSEGKRRVPGVGTKADTRAMITWLARLEQGRIVDRWSSLEIKRLLYTTWRRIRYASSSALKDCAVYFKSGSLYKCEAEAGFTCLKYHGNVDNYMNSVAIVEMPDGTTYLVALMSNVLKKNSDKDHMALAAQIHKLVQSFAPPAPKAAPSPAAPKTTPPAPKAK